MTTAWSLIGVPEPGCDVDLISCENRSNKNNPRIFKLRPGGRPL
ncbi:MAG: hypothetical protein ACRDQG_13425 [Pseudonocardiaceae bacterium]